MRCRIFGAAVVTAGVALLGGGAAAETLWIDLSHPIPTFRPVEGESLEADLDAPLFDSRPHPTFDRQATLTTYDWPTNTGHFDQGTLVIDEHYSTHLDAPNHFLNNEETMEEGGITNEEREAMHQLGTERLVGPIVLLDISERVQAELDKNGGAPSPDTAVTDFSEDSGNVVTPEDIAAVADRLEDGAWLILNLGWSRFYFEGGADWEESVYLNGFNHPGMNREAVDKLVEVMEERGITLAGVGADNLAIDTGEGNVGEGPNMDTDVWYTHTRFFQEGLLILENMANLGELAEAVEGGASCTLVVGALKIVGGTASPSRVFAMCES